MSDYELFYVRTRVSEFRGCKDVLFEWLRDDEITQRPYAELIEGYEPDNDGYAQGAIDELFTLDEANALKAYLDQHHGEHGETTVQRVDLPYRNNVIGVLAEPVGGGDDFYSLWKSPEYSLPFKVVAYFDLRGCELVDEPGETFRPYLLVLGPDGLRRQTQAEARQMEADHGDKIDF
jgi:hypothetical protein